MASDNKSSDVLVIGGGIIGLTSAYQLAKEGVSVTLFDRGQCGQEASWAGAGVLQCGGWHGGYALGNLLRECMLRYPAFTAELFERTRIDPQYIPCGSFEILMEDQQYRMAASEVKIAEPFRETFGRTVLELLSPEQAHELEPNITRECLGVKHCPVTAQVRNPLLVQAVRAACLLEGVRIIEQCEVRELARQGSRVTGVCTSQGLHSAAHVVLAAGSWSPLIDQQLAKTISVYPVRGQIVLLEMTKRPFTHIVERGKCYMVPRLDGRIVIGATEEHDSGFEKRNTAQGINGLLTLSQRLVPVLAEATIVRTWSGLRPGTPDRAPYLGQVPGMDGLIAATGHFRNGLILAPLTAQIVADLIVRGETTYDLSPYAPGRILKKSKNGDKSGGETG